MKYSYLKKVELSYPEALTKIKETLKERGFGVLTEIDVKATMKEKLDEEYDNYMILGACDPPFAHKALQAEKEIGLLLPCNVLVYGDDGGTYVSAILPSVGMQMIDNPILATIAKEVEEKLKDAVDAV